jgi:hypothetical protein
MTIVLPLLLLLSSPEAASQEPLLVVVESSGGAVDASALRDAIGRELGVRVLSPAEEEPMEGVAILTVALASHEAVVTFRREGVTVRRAIELPSDSRKRLQLVAWLAGNVVRDQTSDLLHAPDSDADTPAAAASEAPTEPHADALPSPPPAPPPAPPAPTPAPGPPPIPAPTVAASTSPRPLAGRKQWTVAALAGLWFLDSDRIACNCGETWFSDLGWQGELEVTRSSASFILGGTLMRTRGSAGGLTLGWRRPLRPWLTPELGATVGLWSRNDFEQTTDLFVRLFAGLAASPTAWLDVLARLSVVNAMSDDQYLGYISVGLRYRLPL